MQRIGLDLGTKHIVLSRRDDKGNINTKYEVNGYLIMPRVDAFTKKLLQKQGVPFVERGNELIAIGKKAEQLAFSFNKSLSRPMAEGAVSKSDDDSQEIIAIIIRSIIGKLNDDAILYYCTTSKPINSDNLNVDFHKKIVKLIVEGYQGEAKVTAHHINEARCLILEELGEAVGISWGAGTVTVCAARMGVVGFEFSVVGCLSSDFPVLTVDGVRSICDIKKGDNIVGLNGLATVVNVVNNGRRDELYSIKLDKLQAFDYKMTGDHRVWVKRNTIWQWVVAEDLVVGDVVGVPVTKYKIKKSSEQYYFGKMRGKNVTKMSSRNLGRFFGVFLGDGSRVSYVNNKGSEGGRIKISFNSDDDYLIEKYKSVIFDVFNVVPYVDKSKKVNLINLVFENKAVSKHLCKFYDKDKNKLLPLPVDRIPDQMALGILDGLIDSDGTETVKGGYEFNNTSIHLIMLMHQLLARFGIIHSIYNQEPRGGGVNSNNKKIIGRKESYCIVINRVNRRLLDVLFSCVNYRLAFQRPDYLEYVISSIEKVKYDGDVFDLQVASDDHSFATFGMSVHNCGDWVDLEVAKRFGFDPSNPDKEASETPTTVCRRKESIDLNKMPADNVGKAIYLMYEILVENVVKNIIKGFGNNRDKFRFEAPVPIINSGGTSMPKGFIPMVEREFAKYKDNSPLPVGEIRQVGDPLFAVSLGCMLAAEMHE